eukprot:CAMPEP_0174829210 /NCGR_PEP_ID=MMETSP1114-20130205/1804_1 /TAXON_ID=312471 /ORGANISM="Neobodo designis, Strain CCAP 1951/1" /LENGTH=96 /DNA_ID=CAMNT_0016062955 /DNA_START=28 /DNA_END=315 /DNA_ORIENTATION=+
MPHASWAADVVTNACIDVQILDAHVTPAALCREANALVSAVGAFVSMDDSQRNGGHEEGLRAHARRFDEVSRATSDLYRQKLRTTSAPSALELCDE